MHGNLWQTKWALIYVTYTYLNSKFLLNEWVTHVYQYTNAQDLNQQPLDYVKELLEAWCKLTICLPLCMVGIPADQNSPKWRSKCNIWNLAYWISDSLLYGDISHKHLSYYQLKQVYWRILYMKSAFSHQWVIPKYRLCYLNELTFNGNLLSFIELLTIFCAVFISIFNGN